MSEKVVFSQLSRKFIDENDATPAEAQQVVYYSLAIGHQDVYKRQPPAPARVSTLLDWVPGIRAIAVKCDLCSFDEQGPACVRMCPCLLYTSRCV